VDEGLFGELRRYRAVFLFLVWRDIKVRYKQTLLGAAWAVLQPLLSMVVFTLFFGKLAQMPSEGVPYPIFVYAALVPWTYFSVSLSFASNSLVANSDLISKVYFPRIALPASSAIAGLVDFGIASAVILGLMAWYGVPPTWKLLLWPLLVLPVAALVLGVGMALAALNVKFRDVKYAIPFAVQLWMFMTPVIYPTSLIPERMRFLAYLNPLAGIIETFRATVLPERSVNWGVLAFSVALVALVLAAAGRYFHRTEREFADYI
jgi:lipopolysaccharide transport system permease protein